MASISHAVRSVAAQLIARDTPVCYLPAPHSAPQWLIHPAEPERRYQHWLCCQCLQARLGQQLDIHPRARLAHRTGMARHLRRGPPQVWLEVQPSIKLKDAETRVRRLAVLFLLFA
jgi:hypothetical protein